MIKVIYSLILVSIVFTGCSSSEDTTVNNNPIAYFGTEYDKIKSLEVKSAYETTTEYNNRIDLFIEERGLVTYVSDIYDVYYVEEQFIVLTTYGSGVDTENFGDYYWENIQVDNMNYFPYELKRLYSSSTSSSRIYLLENMEPSEAERLKDTFKIEIKVEYSRNPTISEEHTSSIGNIKNLNAKLKSVKIYSSLDKSKIFEEYSIN